MRNLLFTILLSLGLAGAINTQNLNVEGKAKISTMDPASSSAAGVAREPDGTLSLMTAGSNSSNDCTDPAPHTVLPDSKRLFFMKISGAPSQHSNNLPGLNQSEIVSYGYELSQLNGGSNSCSGITFKIRKEVDRATPKLHQLLLLGANQVDSKLSIYKSTSTSYNIEMTIEFDKHQIKSMNTEVKYAGDENYRLYEVVDLEIIGAIKITYYNYGSNGQLSGTIETYFDCTSGNLK